MRLPSVLDKYVANIKLVDILEGQMENKNMKMKNQLKKESFSKKENKHGCN